MDGKKVMNFDQMQIYKEGDHSDSESNFFNKSSS